jgi:D-methionine transport system substrate-binding protein
VAVSLPIIIQCDDVAFGASTGLEANSAAFRDDIDANVMQHTVFLKSYNDRNKTDHAGIIDVPAPPMGLYSKKHPRNTPVKAGMTVAVPNDPVNLQRALWILRDLGWIEIKDNNPVDVTELDVIKNHSGIKLVPLENAQGPRALDDVDFVAIQGNFAIYSGLKLTDALALEKMTAPYRNVVAVRQGNSEKPWAKDIVVAYRSDTFRSAIRSNNVYDGFALPVTSTELTGGKTAALSARRGAGFGRDLFVQAPGNDQRQTANPYNDDPNAGRSRTGWSKPAQAPSQRGGVASSSVRPLRPGSDMASAASAVRLSISSF